MSPAAKPEKKPQDPNQENKEANDNQKQPSDPVQVQTLRARIAALEKENKELLVRAAGAENLREAVMGLTAEPLVVPKWTVNGKASAKAPDVPVLFTSDFQFGEVVNPNELDGVNAYNIDIGVARYRRLIDRTIKVAKDSKQQYPGIVVLRGGDSVSGDIHKELRETNELCGAAAVTLLAAEEARGIQLLAEHFKNVWVISVPGNHGRTTEKPQSKGYTNNNYDTLVTMMIENSLKNDKRISFMTPESGDAYFNIYGYNFLLTHGDRIGSRGGTGFIGPSATIARGAHKTRQQYAQMKKPIDYLLIGHFHVPIQLEHVICNGTLVGFSEYARDLRVEAEPASQTFFTVSQKFGINKYYKMYVSELDEDIKIMKQRPIRSIVNPSVRPSWVNTR